MTQTFSYDISIRPKVSNVSEVLSVFQRSAEQISSDLQEQLQDSTLLDDETGQLIKNPTITGISLRLMRDTGRHNPATGEIVGFREDRFHVLKLLVQFV